MAVKARRLKDNEIPEKTALYEIRNSCNIAVEEKQNDGSLDQVILVYHVESDDTGYFAKEYRPENVKKEGSKVIDITAVMLNRDKKCIRWHLYDIKDTLAGAGTVTTLYNQWNSGLRYLQENILNQASAYSMTPDLGVITRCYDEERMKRLKNDYQKRCDEIENYSGNMTLPQRKKRTEIVKYRGILRAAQAILDRTFQGESEGNTYNIHIKQLLCEDSRMYKMTFSV